MLLLFVIICVVTIASGMVLFTIDKSKRTKKGYITLIGTTIYHVIIATFPVVISYHAAYVLAGGGIYIFTFMAQSVGILMVLVDYLTYKYDKQLV